jgi:hypothetical protein
MSTPALSRTKIAVGAVMATATLATAGLAASLALAQSAKQDAASPAVTETIPTGQGSTVQKPTRRSDDSDDQPAAKPAKTKTTTSGFGQSKPAQTSNQPAQSRTKGS